VVRALGALGTGAAAGAFTITAGVLVLRTVQAGRILETRETGFVILNAAILGGMALAAITGWLLSAGMPELWRRAAAAVTAVAASLVLSLVAVPADWLAGRAGLALYAVLLVGAVAWCWRQARRAV
jgi:hypothetical protein